MVREKCVTVPPRGHGRRERDWEGSGGAGGWGDEVMLPFEPSMPVFTFHLGPQTGMMMIGPAIPPLVQAAAWNNTRGTPVKNKNKKIKRVSLIVCEKALEHVLRKENSRGSEEEWCFLDNSAQHKRRKNILIMRWSTLPSSIPCCMLRCAVVTSLSSPRSNSCSIYCILWIKRFWFQSVKSCLAGTIPFYVFFIVNNFELISVFKPAYTGAKKALWGSIWLKARSQRMVNPQSKRKIIALITTSKVIVRSCWYLAKRYENKKPQWDRCLWWRHVSCPSSFPFHAPGRGSGPRLCCWWLMWGYMCHMWIQRWWWSMDRPHKGLADIMLSI